MIISFFRLAGVSQTQQRGFRRAVAAHLLLLAGCLAWVCRHPYVGAWGTGPVLLTAGMVEGAMLLGWRLTQLPKSQALEFCFVSPFQPWQFFIAETTVGVYRLLLITLSGLPVLALMAVAGFIDLLDLGPILILPLTWGVLIGLALIVWAYEPRAVRRWAERALLLLLVLYLGVGVLAGEHLVAWIKWLPEPLGQGVLLSYKAFDQYNPFAVLRFWFDKRDNIAWNQLLSVELVTVAAALVLLLRAAGRLRGHFNERHYGPALERRGIWGLAASACQLGDRPLSWWAVRRVSEYSGRVNLWLAVGFAIWYALFTVAGPQWPSWMGRRVFQLFDHAGGIPVWATALVVLAAVPAAFQYGLWDSNPYERCRRLELLLLTRLSAIDYWQAAAAAAWHRGRGYFGAALLLWVAAVLAGQINFVQGLAALTAASLLWGLYFTCGFLAFMRGSQANRLGFGLTIGLPALTFLLGQLGWHVAAGLLPAGTVYQAAALTGGVHPPLAWSVGTVASALLMLLLARVGCARCESELRGWYEKHHGKMILD
jgi:hypothetical protein